MIANLTWMVGVSYSVPMNPHVAAHARGVSILTEIFYKHYYVLYRLS
jgi:hypothetical protein